MPAPNAFQVVLVKIHRLVYRLSGGRLGGTFRGAPTVLLTTTGHKSGRQRTWPLLALMDGEDVVVVASNGGSDRNPAWWHNLRAHPEVEVEAYGERRRMRGETVSAEEKARLWPRLVEMYPTYDEYQRGTRRDIPVVRLRRV